MVKPRYQLSEEEIKQHLARAGLGSLLRRLFFKNARELGQELGLTEEQVQGLLSSRRDLNQELAVKLGRVLGLPPDVLSFKHRTVSLPRIDPWS